MDSKEIDVRFEEVIALASTWQDRANELVTSDEKAYQNRLKKLISHPLDKAHREM